MQFFIYYVFWPMVAGGGFLSLAVVAPEWAWYFLCGWFFMWAAWPIGPYRRRYMDNLVEAFKKDAKATGESSQTKAMIMGFGPIIVMLIAVHVGMALSPIYVEDVLGIDIRAILEDQRGRAEAEEKGRHGGR